MSPAEAAAAAAASATAPSSDSFLHVEAILKEEDVSTSGLRIRPPRLGDTNFFQSDQVKLDEPAADLPGSLKAMEDTMLKLNLGATAAGVGTSVLVVEEEASQSSTDVPMDDGSSAAGVKSQVRVYMLRDVPFKMELVSLETKLLVDRLDKEEIIDLFSKFCDTPKIPAVAFSCVLKCYAAQKAQK